MRIAFLRTSTPSLLVNAEHVGRPPASLIGEIPQLRRRRKELQTCLWTFAKTQLGAEHDYRSFTGLSPFRAWNFGSIRTIRTSSTSAIRRRSTVRSFSKRATKDASYKTDRAHKTHNLNTSSNYIRML